MNNKKYGLTTKSIEKYGFKLALEVFEKYGRKCSLCNGINRLAIHHIDESGNSDNPNNNIDNLQLVCNNCHGRISANKRWRQKQEEFGGYVMKGREKERDKENKQKPSQIKWRREYEIKRKEKRNSDLELLERFRATRREYYRKNKDKIKEWGKQYRKRLKERKVL